MVRGGQHIGDVHSYYSRNHNLSHLHFGINKEFPSYLGYTATSECIDYIGFVDPESFLKRNSPLFFYDYFMNYSSKEYSMYSWGFIFFVKLII